MNPSPIIPPSDDDHSGQPSHHSAESSPSPDDDSPHYERLADELTRGDYHYPTWLRALTEADGDEKRAAAIYNRLRVAMLRSAPPPPSQDAPAFDEPCDSASEQRPAKTVELQKPVVASQDTSAPTRPRFSIARVLVGTVIAVMLLRLLSSFLQIASSPHPVPAEAESVPVASPPLNLEELDRKARNGDAQSIKQLEEVARSDSSPQMREASRRLGKWLLDDGNPHKDIERAVVVLEKAANAGDAEAQWSLGNCYWEKVEEHRPSMANLSDLDIADLISRAPSTDSVEAFKWWHKAAEQGHSQAQVTLGFNYYFHLFGDPTSDDARDIESLKWYRKAAEQGSAAGQCGVGLCYSKGKGVAKDEVEAVNWFKRAAEQGDVEAQYYLALCYGKSRGVPKDDAAAFTWYRKAADGGYSPAYLYLGNCYSDGCGVLKDHAEAMKWYRKAVGRYQSREPEITDFGEAEFRLGLGYEQGEAVAKDAAKAVEWYTKAAEWGNLEAYYRLGWAYAVGNGVSKDETKAVEWWTKGAEYGDAKDQYELGCRFDFGMVIPKDSSKAAQWYARAANQGHAEAQFNLGLCYLQGRGVSQDRGKATEWFKKAASQGWVQAKQMLNQTGSRNSAVTFGDPSQHNPSPQVVIPTPTPRSGTGFLINTAGHILTAAHVVESASQLSVSIGGGSPVVATVVSIDKANDLALLKLSSLPADAMPLPLAVADERTGAAVFTLGFPNTAIQGREPKLTDGRISSTSGIRDDPRIYQISVPVQPGNSGGPLLNMNGEVVGVMVSRLSAANMLKLGAGEPQNVNYAVKISIARSLTKGVTTFRAATTTAQDLPALVEKTRRSIVLITAK